MNLVIENLYGELLDNSDISSIKTIKGEFTKQEIKDQIGTLSYNKVIIDITAIKNYFDYITLFDFLSYFDKSRVILLLNNQEVINNTYISNLVKEGYYNFSKNIQGIGYLIEHPNDIKDVEKYIVANTYQNPLLNNNDSKAVEEQVKDDNVIYRKNPNQVIIGIQNLSPHAGATTLMYMMIKQLRLNYKVIGIEMMSQDYIYFRDSDLVGCTSLEDLKMVIKTLGDKEVILIDLNDIDGKDVCDKVIYLLETGITKLNKFIKRNIDTYELMKNGVIVLNRSPIKDEEIANFEYETKLKVFYNLINFNDRKERIQVIDRLLLKLGFNKQQPKGGLLSLFK